MIHQNVPHHSCGHREKVCTVLPCHVPGIDQTQIRFIDERCCLEAVARALSSHASTGNLVKLALDQRNQAAEGDVVALPPFQKQSRGSRWIVRNIAILCPFLAHAPSCGVFPFTDRRSLHGSHTSCRPLNRRYALDELSSARWLRRSALSNRALHFAAFRAAWRGADRHPTDSDSHDAERRFDRGGSWGSITGNEFESAATVTLGNRVLRSISFRDSTTLLFWLNDPHTAGTVDVVVTNPGGAAATLTAGFTYVEPESLDFNGDWLAHAGPDYETDMRLTIRNNELVSFSCGTSGTLTPSIDDVDTQRGVLICWRGRARHLGQRRFTHERGRSNQYVWL